jgi:hypothetical protein
MAVTSEAEVLWILLAFRLRPPSAAVRLVSEDPNPAVRRRTKPTLRPSEGRASGIYATAKSAEK